MISFLLKILVGKSWITSLLGLMLISSAVAFWFKIITFQELILAATTIGGLGLRASKDSNKSGADGTE